MFMHYQTIAKFDINDRCALSRLSFERAENRLGVHAVVSSHVETVVLMSRV